MKLKNRKTGEIVIKHLAIKDNNEVAKTYSSLAELNEEWEDYEEPKEYWFIENDGHISSIRVDEDFAESLRASKDLGNYFETKEEAEKAVERLRAWKRLKDIGCDFDGWNVKSTSSDGDHLLINLYVKHCTRCWELLGLLFGGEE